MTNKLHQQDEMRAQIELNDTVKIELLGLATFPPNSSGIAHDHPFWELVYISRDVPAPFTFIVEDMVMDCSHSTLFLLPPNKTHEFINHSESGVQNLYVGFSFKLEPYTHIRHDLPLILSDDDTEVKIIKALFNEIAAHTTSEAKQIFIRKRIDILRSLLHVISLIVEDEAEYQPNQLIRSVMCTEKVIKYIKNNLNKHISINDIANQLYFSPSYLGQIFRQVTGTTIKNYHHQMRMEYAYELIRAGKHSISEVAQLLGFESVAYFSRRFKAMYGISPSQIITNQ